MFAIELILIDTTRYETSVHRIAKGPFIKNLIKFSLWITLVREMNARKLRCAFIIFGCCMFVLCMALAGPGLASVVNTTKSVRKLRRDVNDLTTQGLVILDSLESDADGDGGNDGLIRRRRDGLF